MPDFLLEIGTEEIPARMIENAWIEMAKRLSDLLLRESLWNAEPSPGMTGIGFLEAATPRRLALVVPGVMASQPDVTEQITGPSFKVAFKDGKPTPAAEAFAKKAGVDVAQLRKGNEPQR